MKKYQTFRNVYPNNVSRIKFDNLECIVFRTGHALLHTLYGYSTKFDNIEFFTDFFVLDLLKQDDAMVGALALNMDTGCLHRSVSCLILLQLILLLEGYCYNLHACQTGRDISETKI